MVKTKVMVAIVLVGILGFVSHSSAGSMGNMSKEELMRLLMETKKQVEMQQKQIENLLKKVDSIEKSVAAGVSPATEEKVEGLLKGVVKSRGTKVKAKLYGQVNRGVLYVNDGNSDEYIHVDNDNSSTRIGFVGDAQVTDDLSVGTLIEVQFESNSSSAVDQNNTSGVGPNNFTERHLDLFFKSKKFGKLSLGQGSTASDGTSEVDLSGTAIIGYSSTSDMNGSILFYDDDADMLSNVEIGDVATNMDGLGRRDRARYDTPNFAGFTFSGSLTEGDEQDLAVRYAAKFPGAKFAAAAAYANRDNSSTIENQYNASASILLDNGLNLTVAGGFRDMIDGDRDDPTFFYVKLGYLAELCELGKTAFAIDYGKYYDIAQNDDESDTIGLFAVQNLNKVGSELYFGYRWNSLDNRPGTDYNDIHSVLTGARVKF